MHNVHEFRVYFDSQGSRGAFNILTRQAPWGGQIYLIHSRKLYPTE